MIDSTWYKKPNNIPTRITSGGIVVRREDDKTYIALILEGRFSDFSLPKGGVKRGESLEDAARREIHEEAGLFNLTLVEYIGKRERLNISKTKWTIVHYFLFTTQQLDGQPTDQRKRHVLKWFSVDNLPYMMWPEQKKLILDTAKRIDELSFRI